MQQKPACHDTNINKTNENVRTYNMEINTYTTFKDNK